MQSYLAWNSTYINLSVLPHPTLKIFQILKKICVFMMCENLGVLKLLFKSEVTFQDLVLSFHSSFLGTGHELLWLGQGGLLLLNHFIGSRSQLQMCDFQFKSQGYILKVFIDHLLARYCFLVLGFIIVNKAHGIYTLMKTNTTISCSLENDKRYEQNMNQNMWRSKGHGLQEGCLHKYIHLNAWMDPVGT